MSTILTEPYNFKKQVLATNMMIEVISEIVKERKFKVLWYLEISDSYSFCLVSPEVYKQLNNTKLGYDHEFKAPKFKLNGYLE